MNGQLLKCLVCGRVYGDGSGNLYTNTEYTLSNETGVLLPLASLLVTLNAGFTAHTLQTKTEGHLTAYTPDGKVLSSTPLFGRHSAAGTGCRLSKRPCTAPVMTAPSV